jgi:hypothetical protein
MRPVSAEFRLPGGRSGHRVSPFIALKRQPAGPRPRCSLGPDHGHPERPRGIIADTAVRLGRYFGNGAQFWLDLQGQYDIAIVERDRGEEIPPGAPRGRGLTSRLGWCFRRCQGVRRSFRPLVCKFFSSGLGVRRTRYT